MKLKSSTLAKMAVAAGGIGLVAAAAVTQLGARNDLRDAPPATPVAPIEESCTVPETVPVDGAIPLPPGGAPPLPPAIDHCPGCALG